MLMKKWDIVGKLKTNKEKIETEEIIQLLLENRGITDAKEIEEFLTPKLESVTIDAVGIDKKELKKAVSRIQTAIEKQEQIVVYGDYDVDGICGSAILWEALHGLGAKVTPYIPHRMEEGYGLSIAGIENLKEKFADITLIITVDNGIVANEAVDFANKNGIDVIISDHHVPAEKLPNAFAIVHTTKLCGTAVGFLLSKEFGSKNDDHLELVALATIADLVPLLSSNRTLTKFGIEKLHQTKRPGLLALFHESGIDKNTIGTYEIGHVIAPRLNAMGRLESAMDSLRLICTKDHNRAEMLAGKLSQINRQRQQITQETVLHARTSLGDISLVSLKKLIFISHETYQQGVIGLVAGKLVEEFYRPAIVIAKGEKLSKASARSIHGFNMIEFIRNASEFLIDVGGHPMAAGFTVQTDKISLLQAKLEKLVEDVIKEEHLLRTLRIDCEIDLSAITNSFYQVLSRFEPFGMTNPQPVFVSKNITIEDMRLVGKDRTHVKLRLVSPQASFDAIAFGMGTRSDELKIGNTIDIVYTIDKDTWNGNNKLQLKVKDFKLVS